MIHEPNCLEIDLSAITHNLRQIKNMAGNHSENGKKLLEKMDVQIADTVREAVRFCIEYIGEINK